MNKNEETANQNVWDTAKEMHKGRFTATKCLYQKKNLKTIT